MTQVNYAQLVAQAKVAARDVLRTEKVNDLLKWISGCERDLASIENNIKAADHRLAMAEYKLRISAHFESPLLEEETKDVQNILKYHDEDVARCNKDIESVKAKIAEYQAKIEAWNTGESKVCADSQNALALQFVKSKIGEAFVQGEYDNAVSS